LLGTPAPLALGRREAQLVSLFGIAQIWHCLDLALLRFGTGLIWEGVILAKTCDFGKDLI
jgi:hypothetical protein